MDTVAFSGTAIRKGKKSEKSRRVWTLKEEEVLIQALKDAINSGFKSENGFRAGYLVFLEDAMKKAFSETDLRAIPHINSKIHVWKRTHGILQTMLSRSGIGWNENEKMIEASTEAWESFVQMDSSVRTMRYKSWPLYNDWCEIFGNDRATGEHAESFADAIQGVLNIPMDVPDMQVGLDEFFRGVEGAGESISVSNAPSLTPVARKQTTSKKRKKLGVDEGTFVDAINSFTEMSKCTMSDLVKRIGVEYDQANSEKDVFEALGRIVELSAAERIRAASLLVDRPKQLRLFYTLPDESRLDLVRNLLTEL